MSRPEVDWTIEQFGSVIESIDVPLRRVDRDSSRLYDGDGMAPDMDTPIHQRSAELKQANFVGVTFADRDRSPIGTEYDHRVEAVVGVRVEGLHHSEWGHVDPDGEEGIAWSDGAGLVDRLQDAVTDARTWPDAGDANTRYTDLRLANEADASDGYADYFRCDWDVLFRGYEDL